MTTDLHPWLAQWDNYEGYLKPWLHKIVVAYCRGDKPTGIARQLRSSVAKVYPEAAPLISAQHVNHVLRSVGLLGERRIPMPRLPAQKYARQEEVWKLREDGLTFKEIGQQLGVSKQRAQQIWMGAQRRHELAAKRASEKKRDAARRNLGRPIDMGGPRDVWIEQGPWDER